MANDEKVFKTSKVDVVKDVSFFRKSLIISLIVAGVAAGVFAFTIADYFYPGESAHLFTQWVGMDALDFPSHPVWGALVKAFGGDVHTVSAFRLNLFSLI